MGRGITGGGERMDRSEVSKVIVIGTPTRDSVSAGFATDLVGLIKRTTHDVDFVPAIGTIVPNNRNMLVQVARALGASHLLFIDSDMRFPVDVIDRLLRHEKPVIAANCMQRTQDAPTARNGDGPIYFRNGRSGIEQVTVAGTGVMLIRMDVFDRIEPPYFTYAWDRIMHTHVGEDVMFCERLRRAGVEIWIDNDLSQSVWHEATVLR